MSCLESQVAIVKFNIENFRGSLGSIGGTLIIVAFTIGGECDRHAVSLVGIDIKQAEYTGLVVILSDFNLRSYAEGTLHARLAWID